MFDIPVEIPHNESRKEGNIMAKNTPNKTPEAQLQATARYHETLERVVFRLHADGRDGLTKEIIAKAAEKVGESMNTFIIEAIRQRMARF